MCSNANHMCINVHFTDGKIKSETQCSANKLSNLVGNTPPPPGLRREIPGSGIWRKKNPFYFGPRDRGKSKQGGGGFKNKKKDEKRIFGQKTPKGPKKFPTKIFKVLKFLLKKDLKF